MESLAWIFDYFADAYDTDEWHRMHYGPTAAERDTATWERERAARQARTGGSSSGSSDFGGPRTSFSAADSFRMSQQAFARSGQDETQQYRAFAQRFRASRAAADRQFPALVGALSAVMLGVYLIARKLDDR